MMDGRQPPVWSPLSFRALLSAAKEAWLGGGDGPVRALERRLRAMYRPIDLWLLDSGTSALTVALRAAHSWTGAPVALPAYSCFDVATAADGASVPFLLYDLDRATLSPDLSSLQATLDAGARAVVVAHLYGVPADLAAVEALTAPVGALLIEDAAQGSGCERAGRPAGSFGALSVLSFGRGKGWTGGGGGALLAHSPDLASVVSRLDGADGWVRVLVGSAREFLALTAQWALARPGLYTLPASLPFLGLGETRYRRPHRVTGISALAAGVLEATASLVPEEVTRRRRRAEALGRGIRGVSRMFPPAGWTPGWLRFPVVRERTDLPSRNRELLRAGVMPGYPVPLSRLGGFGDRRLNRESEFPGAEQLVAGLVTVPTHRFVQDAKLPAF